jgi:hypothetical protein
LSASEMSSDPMLDTARSIEPRRLRSMRYGTAPPEVTEDPADVRRLAEHARVAEPGHGERRVERGR